jgi:hypothetical protein
LHILHDFMLEWFLAELLPLIEKGVNKVKSCLVVHLIDIFRFIDFCQSDGPLMVLILDYSSFTTNAFSMKLITGLIGSSSIHAYYTGF